MEKLLLLFCFFGQKRAVCKAEPYRIMVRPFGRIKYYNVWIY
ncbi:hypothetical protein ANASTE_01024 [Anaerofustis stercorihominis DSM 17244]|uniref:Uncharacterized protein n=1 Tax=Anaerofustis stercorihominis DSM 17244 TaxID=445971 RepID=B1C8G7_9FIRM|nr:hypothetical protein ANASTE_01024 [Anaerofustis stercorihominis DSM 17244]